MPLPKPSKWIDLFPGRMKAMREKAGLSQQQLADKVKISRAFVALIESGKRVPSVPVLGRIMDECSAAVGTKKAAESWMKITENGQHHEDSKKRSANVIGQIAPKE